MARKLLGFVGLFAVLVGGVFAVRALSAQAHGGMMGMMSMMEDCRMVGGMTQGPEAALGHAAELALSEEQVQRLEALQQDAPVHGAMMTRMHDLHARMKAATEGASFDEAAARAAFEEMTAMHAEAGVEMLRTRHAVRQILTPAQREKLDDLDHDGTRGMHGMMGAMQNCPMMRAGATGGHHGMEQEG